MASNTEVNSEGLLLKDQEPWRTSKLLGSLMCSTADIRHCICLANAAFNTFTKLWMQPPKISITLLMHVYNAMVLSVFMYNSSSWAAPKNVHEKLNTCHRCHL